MEPCAELSEKFYEHEMYYGMFHALLMVHEGMTTGRCLSVYAFARDVLARAFPHNWLWCTGSSSLFLHLSDADVKRVGGRLLVSARKQSLQSDEDYKKLTCLKH